MPVARSDRPLPLAGLAAIVASGLGLLVIAVVGIWRSLESAQARLELLARQECQRVAAALQDGLLRDDGASAGTEFTVRDGALVVPAELGALDEADELVGETVLARDVAEFAARLRQSARDPAALAALREAFDAEADDLDAAAARALGAAFFALHSAQPQWCAALLQRLCGFWQSGKLARDRADAVAISSALLAARVAPAAPPRDWPPRALAPALARLSSPQADAVLDRLAELLAPSPEVDAWRDALRAEVTTLAAQRAQLRRVRECLPRLAATGSAIAFVPAGNRDAPELVQYWPAAAGRGRGRIGAAHEQLAALFAAASPSDDVALVHPVVDATRGVTVLEGAWQVAPAVRAATGAPWLLGTLLLALALLFATALWSTLRGLRRAALAQQARSEFLTSVTHELKTPLASLRLLSELLASKRVADAAEQQEYHELLASETTRLCALVENVLDLGRTERGERGLESRPVSVAEWLAETCAILQPMLAREGLPLHVDTVAAELTVRGDRGALTQALLNVLENARKYGASARGVQVTASASGAQVRVAVRDFGPGVPEAERERVFGKFVRGRAQASGAVPGLGLGLYLARAIARAHGGELSCTAPDDGAGGALLLFTLPRMADP